jgi:hypothetical protein
MARARSRHVRTSVSPAPRHPGTPAAGPDGHREHSCLRLAGPCDVGYGTAGRHEGHAAERAAVLDGHEHLGSGGPLGHVAQLTEVFVALSEVEQSVAQVGPRPQQ